MAATVHDLPAELLLAVFRQVFLSQYAICSPSSAKCMTCRRIGTHHVAWGPTESFDPADPALFPAALAAVSPSWRAVLATVPEYWTRPVVFVDDAPTSPAEFHDTLRFSRSLPIELYIVARPASESEDEQEHVRAAIEVLKPHLPRCQHIFIRLSRSSSLPSLRHDFVGTAPYLTQLKLECQTDDGPNTAAYTQPVPKTPFRCPALYTLLIDGPNFREIALSHHSWWASTFSTLKLLIIHNLSSGPPLPFATAIAAFNLHTLHDLHTLCLNNINLDTASLPPTFPFALQMLHLSQIPLTLISHFFRYTFLGDLYSIRIDSCPFPPEDIDPNSVSIPNTFSLTLKHFTHPAPLISLLRFWGGHRLNIGSCPGFDDSVLAMMRSPLPNCDLPHDPLIPGFGCPNLSMLYLADCESYTAEGVRQLVEVRNQSQTAALGSIESLTISGKAPKMDEDPREYFDDLQVVKWMS